MSFSAPPIRQTGSRGIGSSNTPHPLRRMTPGSEHARQPWRAARSETFRASPGCQIGGQMFAESPRRLRRSAGITVIGFVGRGIITDAPPCWGDGTFSIFYQPSDKSSTKAEHRRAFTQLVHSPRKAGPRVPVASMALVRMPDCANHNSSPLPDPPTCPAPS
jgi:hypothetical protein